MRARGIRVAVMAAGLAFFFSCSGGREPKQESPNAGKVPDPFAPKLEERTKPAPAKEVAVVTPPSPRESPIEAPRPAAPEPAAPAAAGRVLPPPKDEASREPSLVTFIAKLKDVLRRKDPVALFAMLASDATPGIGSATGATAFLSSWSLTDSRSPLFAVITQILSLPGVWQGEQFCGPYAAVQFPADLSRSRYQVVLNHDLKLRAEASESAKTLAVLNYSIVEVVERGEWTKVRTESGIEGFVPVAYLYSPGGYRMCLAKDAAGEWKIQSISAK